MKTSISRRFLKSSLLVLLAATLLFATPARAELIYALTNVANAGGSLVSFDSATPGAPTTIGAITGATDLRAIDFRPSNSLLYGAGYTGATGTFQLYTISLTTAVATPVGLSFVLPAFQNTTRLSIDVNPMADALRVITSNGNSYRVNLTTGALIAQDTAFNGPITTASHADIAYSNNVAGAGSTSLYGYEFNTDSIILVNPPNSGTYTVVGGLGGPSAFSSDVGFDISGSGIAYLNLDDGPSPTAADEFYTINLATGAATFVGTSTFDLLDISAAPVPEPGTYALLAMGALSVMWAASRRAAKA
jgi:Domain of unknown function (DUF4394)/PEP-CTERM motif